MHNTPAKNLAEGSARLAASLSSYSTVPSTRWIDDPATLSVKSASSFKPLDPNSSFNGHSSDELFRKMAEYAGTNKTQLGVVSTFQSDIISSGSQPQKTSILAASSAGTNSSIFSGYLDVLPSVVSQRIVKNQCSDPL